MTFEAALKAAKLGNTKALSFLIELYYPLIAKSSIEDGVFHEDLEQEFLATLLKCVRKFDPKRYQ